MEELKKSEAEIMEEWRNNLRSINTGNGGDVFEMIKRAIMVAAFDHPTEFLKKRDEIAQILFSIDSCNHHVQQQEKIGCENKMKDDDVNINHGINNYSGSSSDGELVHENHMVTTTTTDDDEVLRIKHILDTQHDSESAVYESLSKLEEMGGMSFKTLEATKIGISVKGFQKHASMEIRQIARRLIKKWRCVADEWIEAEEKTSSSCVVQQEKKLEEEKESEVAEKQMVVKKESNVVKLRIIKSPIPEKAKAEEEKKESEAAQKQIVMMKKESSSSVVNLMIISQEKANMEEEKSQSIERKIEESKRKLHQRYEEAESVKRQRKIQVIQPYQLTKMQKQGLNLILPKTKYQNTRIKI